MSRASNGSRVEIPQLVWPGRRWRGGAGALDGAEVVPPACLPYEQGVDGARLILGDALDVARALRAEGLAGRVDLVYVDPPFASQTDYVHEARLDGPADGRVVRAPAYTDRWSSGRSARRAAEGAETGHDTRDPICAYLDELAPRLEALTELLAPTGCIWVHLDWRAAYLVRAILDEILGRDAFVNEVQWRRAPNLGRQAASHQFGRTLDTLLVYAKTPGGLRLRPPTRLEPIEKSSVRWDPPDGDAGDENDQPSGARRGRRSGQPFTTAPRGDYTDESIARLEREGRVYRTASGRVYVKYFLVKNAQGVWCRERRVDTLWTDIAPLRHAGARERTGYPTQKPRALLERIIACSTPPGGLVVDLFSGSGTTGDAAQVLGRKFVLGDRSELAIATARARLLRAGTQPRVDLCGASWRSSDEPIEVDVEPRGDGVAVVLREPAEPAAWAIDAAYDPGRPFHATWHSERRPGNRAVPAAREAVLPVVEGRIAIRVFGDDGAVGERVLDLSAIANADRCAESGSRSRADFVLDEGTSP